MRTILVLAALTAALAACGKHENRMAGGVSEGEAKALDDAAEMVDGRRLPDSALRIPASQQRQPAAPAAR